MVTKKYWRKLAGWVFTLILIQFLLFGTPEIALMAAVLAFAGVVIAVIMILRHKHLTEEIVRDLFSYWYITAGMSICFAIALATAGFPYIGAASLLADALLFSLLHEKIEDIEKAANERTNQQKTE